MQNDEVSAAARVSAVSAILDRGWGKPQHAIDANMNWMDTLLEDELRALIAALKVVKHDESGPEAGTAGVIN